MSDKLNESCKFPHGTIDYEISWKGGLQTPPEYTMILEEAVPCSGKEVSLEIVFKGEKAHCFCENRELLKDFQKFIKQQVEAGRLR